MLNNIVDNYEKRQQQNILLPKQPLPVLHGVTTNVCTSLIHYASYLPSYSNDKNNIRHI